MVEGAKIFFFTILAAAVYGILHDMVTARVCVEYFTIGHPPVFKTIDPTLLALGWGILATWWVGAALGVPLALTARAGALPPLGSKELVKPLAVLLGTMAVLALLAGIAGYVAAGQRWVWLLEPLASRVPKEKHAPFLADLWAHLASYVAGFIGGIVLCVRNLRVRRKRGHSGVS
ncbi:MAG: hypothetical protein L6R28_24760 [Planctomycetes bacterium]|nr:hypothetical protein [Planctomycetota bacterium]